MTEQSSIANYTKASSNEGNKQKIDETQILESTKDPKTIQALLQYILPTFRAYIQDNQNHEYSRMCQV